VQRRKYIDLSDPSNDGYLPHATHNWWFDADEPNAFEIFDLDGFYYERYYSDDHVHRLVVGIIVACLLEAGRDVSGRDVGAVLDLGCGQGQFTRALLAAGADVTAVEGSEAGVARALELGTPADRLHRHDLRLPLHLDRRFDIVMCTEVAEHIETPFSSQLIQTIGEHSDVCWFSSEPPGTNQDHLHHCNEQPDIFWINLFRFHGFQPLPIDIDVRVPSSPDVAQFCTDEFVLRGRYVFVRGEEDLSDRRMSLVAVIDEDGALTTHVAPA
jgi:SAM-dependent methyltransferase